MSRSILTFANSRLTRSSSAAVSVFNGLPAGDFPASIFEIVLKGLTVRGSIVGTRQDMREALDFYSRGQIHPTITTRKLDEINAVFGEMKKGKIEGRVVITY